MTYSNKLINYENIHTAKKREFLFQEISKVATEILSIFENKKREECCPCCGSELIAEYTKKFGFNLDICTHCRHIFTNPFPSNEALNYYYNSNFKEFENEFFLESFDRRLPIFDQRLSLIESISAGRNILDVGSAVGIFLEANERRGGGLNITACDLNKSSCDYLTVKYPTVKVINKDVTLLENANYDIVTLWDTFEHIPNPISLLSSIKRQLRIGGYFIFSTPNTLSFEWGVMGDNHVQLLPPGHVNLYNVQNIRILLNVNGFEVEDIKTMNPMLDLTYIHNVFKNLDVEQDLFGRASKRLMDIVLNEKNLPSILKFMEYNLMAGNMIIVARKND